MMAEIKTKTRSGIALITVLFVVMAASIIALGIIVRSDMELACGKNIIKHTEMDYLAQSALTHAKTLLMYPQNVTTTPAGYWTGETSLQIDDTSSDYYDLAVTQSAVGFTKRLDYQVVASAYHLTGGLETAKCNLIANVHIDPCLTYWQSVQGTMPAEVTIYGDVYCDDNITILGYLDGDVYSKLTITDGGTITGNSYNSVALPPVPLHPLAPEDYNSEYYIGADSYAVSTMTPGSYPDLMVDPSAGNPAGIRYCSGSVQLDGDCQINGTLVVRTDLTLNGTCNLTIAPQKNFPALIVGRDLIFANDNISIDAKGLVQVKNRIDMMDRTGSSINILGALCVLGDGILNTTGCTVTVTTDPAQAAMKIDTAIDSTLWTPAGDAIYKSIQ